MIRSFILCIMAFLFANPLQGIAKEVTATFNAPAVKGVRLDWCKHWARDCGAPAATLFCRENGYQKAVRFLQAPNLGSKGIDTLVFGDGRLCKARNCSGFRSIVCVRTVQDDTRTIQSVVPRKPDKPDTGTIVGRPAVEPGPKMTVTVINSSSTRFGYPAIKKVRVDWCRHWRKACGEPAANLFCLEKGFKRAVDFRMDKSIGKKGIASLVFGDGRICKGKNCRGFRHITCTREPVSKDTIARVPDPDTSQDGNNKAEQQDGVSEGQVRATPQVEQSNRNTEQLQALNTIPVPSPRPQTSAIGKPAIVAIPKAVVSLTDFRPATQNTLITKWAGTLASLNTYPAGADLFKCSSGDCSIAHSADFGVNPEDAIQSVQLNFSVLDVPHATGALWQVSYLPFPAFANGGEADLDFSGMLASEIANSKQGWFTFDLAELSGQIPSTGAQAIIHVRVLPIAAADEGHVVGQPSNVMRIYYGIELPPQDPYEIYTKEDIPGSKPDVQLVSLKFEPFKRVARWPPGCKTWEEKYGKKKNFLEKVGKFFSGAWDWTTGAYQWTKDRVVDVASALTLNLISDDVLSFALDSALVSAGIPPDIPNLDKLMKDGVDGLAKEVAKSAVQQIPTADLATNVGSLAADIAIDTAKDMAEDALRERLEEEIEKRSRQALLAAAEEMEKELKSSGKKALCKTTYFDPVFHVVVQNMSDKALDNVEVTVSADPVHRGKTWNVDMKPRERRKLVTVGKPILPNGPYSHPLLRANERLEEDRVRWWNEVVYLKDAIVKVTLPGVLRCLGGDPKGQFCERETIIAHKSPPQLVSEPYSFSR